MKILIVYQYFGTPRGSWSTRMYENAKYWHEQGNEVEILTTPYEKSDIKAKGFISKELIDGLNVTIVNLADNNRQHKIVRAVKSLLFALISSWICLFRSYEVLLSSSGPITVGIPFIITKKLRPSVKTVFEVRDLWPLGGIELGLIKKGIQANSALKFEKSCYNNADLIVCASPGQAKSIHDRFFRYNPLVIPNACDIDLFGKEIDQALLPDKYRNIKILLHIGSLGLIHNIEFWIEVAEKMKYRNYNKQVMFVFIGEGANRKLLENKLIQKRISNFHFLGLMPKRDLPLWVQCSYATLFATTNNPVQDTSSPNKVFDSLAAGVPIIQTSKGWIKDLVDSYECGINVSIADINSAAESIIDFLENQNLRDRCARNAKKLARHKFERKSLAQEYLEQILQLQLQ